MHRVNTSKAFMQVARLCSLSLQILNPRIVMKTPVAYNGAEFLQFVDLGYGLVLFAVCRPGSNSLVAWSTQGRGVAED